MPLTIKPSSGSGSSTLISVAGTTTNDTLTLPAKTGNIITSADTGTVTQTMLATNVAGNGPAFSVYNNANQTISFATFTKVTLNTEDYDTNNNFDSTTNYRFTPTVAGYYQIDAFLRPSGSSTMTLVALNIYKNNTSLYRVAETNYSATGPYTVTGSCIVYFNGSTDYIELYAYIAGTGTATFNYTATDNCSRLQAALVRSA